jgi:membrane protease YdiL (CAAX protease family)
VRPDRRRSRRPFAGTEQPPPRLGAVPAAARAEYLTVSYSIDARTLLVPAGLEGLLGGVGAVAPLGFLVVVGAWFAGGEGARAILRDLEQPSAPPSQRWLALGIHVATLAVLYLVTQVVTGGQPRAVDPSLRPWLLAWFLLVPVAVAALAAAFWLPARLARALWAARAALVVGLVVGVLALGAGLLAQVIAAPFIRATLEVVHAILTVLASDPVASVETAEVGTARFFISIAPVCSGIEGLGLMAAFLGVFLYVERRTLPGPSPGSCPLGAGGDLAAQRRAGGHAHRHRDLVLPRGRARRLPLEGGLAVLHAGGARRRLDRPPLGAVPGRGPRRFRRPRRRAEPGRGLPAAAARHPRRGAIVTGLFTHGFDAAYPLRVLAAAALLYAYRRAYPRLDLTGGWLAVAVGLADAALWIAVFPRTDPEAGATLRAGVDALPTPLAAAWVAFRLLGAVVTVPLAEELAFRGYRCGASWRATSPSCPRGPRPSSPWWPPPSRSGSCTRSGCSAPPPGWPTAGSPSVAGGSRTR